jgi:hypothetical protein
VTIQYRPASRRTCDELGARKLDQRICGVIEVAEDCEAGLIRRLLIEHHVDTGSRRRRTEDNVRLSSRRDHQREESAGVPFLQSVENWLDANVAQYKDCFTTPHVKQVVSTLLTR